MEDGGLGLPDPLHDTMPIVNVPWVQHIVTDLVCTQCGYKNIPSMAVQADGTAYEKQGRFLLGRAPKYELCVKGIS